ncbi:MAG: hypothetical protein Q8920_08245 [Bacillota bacterium]|nr:hypothetical protein [Bacillota bacterium]
MKKTKEILGLPIISISDAVEKGKVKGIIVNAEKGAVDYIIVDSGFQVIGMRVISTENVLGIGEYALTIENEKSIIDIGTVPQAVELLQNDVQVKNTKVMTKKGRLIGETGDYFADEEIACSIAGLEFISEKTKGTTRIIPRKNVITFGKNLIVVTDDVESTLLDDIAGMSSEMVDFGLEKKNPIIEDIPVKEEPSNIDSQPSVGIPDSVVEETLEESFDEESEEEQPAEAEEEPAEVLTIDQDNEEEIKEIEEAEEIEENEVEAKPAASSVEGSAANLFEQRQRQYLKGRTATKTITDNSGSVLANEGTVISDDIIDAVKASGKMIELVMNNRA